MKAIGVYKALPIEHPESLIEVEIPISVPGANDLLVHVDAISVNPADFRMRGRKADDGKPAILGWDAAGTIVSTGPGVSSEFSVGDSVYYAGDLMRPGANSEFHLVDSRIVGHCPRTLSIADAAAVPLTALTAWEALFERMSFSMEGNNRLQTLLIIGAAGGTGSISIQLAKLVPGLTVFATASRPESQAWCRGLGADYIIDHFQDMKDQLTALGLTHIDAILVLNGPDEHFPALAEILAPQGVFCSIVPFEAPPDINLIMRKSATFAWEFMFTRSMFGTADIDTQRRILNAVASLVDDGRIRPVATQNLGAITARNLRAAHAQLESRRTIGKLTLAGF